jgi:hypothetical protein
VWGGLFENVRTAGYGGFLRTEKGNLTVTDVILSNVTSDSLGGAISCPGIGNVLEGNLGGRLSLGNCTFHSCRARNTGSSVCGGGLCVVRFQWVSFVNCTFRQCFADDGGGAFYVRKTVETVLDSCVFEANSASRYGGGFRADELVAFTFTDCQLINNSCGSNYGAVYLSVTGTFVTSGCCFQGNTAAKYTIGYVRSAPRFCLSSWDLNDTCLKGLLEFGSGSNVVLDNLVMGQIFGTISVLFFFSGCSLEIVDGAFDSIQTVSDGPPVIWLQYSPNHDLVLSNCVFENLSTAGDGAALYLYQIRSTCMTNCSFRRCTGKHGAVYHPQAGDINLTQCIFEFNRATTDYGAFAMWTGRTFMFRDVDVFNNSAVTTCGGCYARADTAFVLQNVRFYDNIADSMAVGRFGVPRVFDFDDIDITINESRGILCFEGPGTLVLHDLHFGQRLLLSKSVPPLFYIYLSGVILSDCTFDSIRSVNGRAILWVENYHDRAIVISNCTFENITATGDGCCLLSSLAAELSLRNCSFRHCTSSSGGAFYSSLSHIVTLTQCLFEFNKALSDYGALAVTGAESLAISDVDVFNNTAVSQCGGCYVAANPHFTMRNFRVYDNIANSLSVGSFGTPYPLDFDDLDIRINESCSILRFDGAGKLILHDRHFASRLLLSSVVPSMFYVWRSRVDVINCTFYSIRSRHGVAILIVENNYQGEVIMTNCTFENVSSPGDGGSLRYRCPTVLSISNCSFYHCTGGTGALFHAFVPSDVSLMQCLFEFNHAVDVGSFMIDAAANLAIVDCDIFNNSASSRYGGCSIRVTNLFTFQHLRISDNVANSLSVGSFNLAFPLDFDDLDITINESCSILRWTGAGKLILHDRHFGPRRLLSSLTSSMFYIDHSSVDVVNCTFDSDGSIHNTAILWVENYGEGPVIISNCTFANASSPGNGGCLYFRLPGVLNITDCSFRHCSGQHAGAFSVAQAYHVHIIKCLLEFNRATVDSGAFVVDGGLNAIVREVAIFNNSAVRQYGGCYLAVTTTLVFEDVHIYDNIAESNAVGRFQMPYPFDFDDFNITINESCGILTFGGTGPLILHDRHFGPRLLLSTLRSALFVLSYSSIDIINCTFDSVRSTSNTAILWVENYLAGEVFIANCTFENVSCPGEWSCVYATRPDLVTIADCTFSHGSARYGAILYTGLPSIFIMTSCLVVANYDTYGHGLFLIDSRGVVKIEKCRFISNGLPGTHMSLMII